MSITQITEREQQLTHYLAEVTKALELMRQERDALKLSIDELRKAVASLIVADTETWPRHGNTPLAIAALVQSLLMLNQSLVAENKVLRDAWSAEPIGYISEYEKDSAMDKFRYLPSKMYPTPVYTRSK